MQRPVASQQCVLESRGPYRRGTRLQEDAPASGPVSEEILQKVPPLLAEAVRETVAILAACNPSNCRETAAHLGKLCPKPAPATASTPRTASSPCLKESSAATPAIVQGTPIHFLEEQDESGRPVQGAERDKYIPLIRSILSESSARDFHAAAPPCRIARAVGSMDTPDCSDAGNAGSAVSPLCSPLSASRDTTTTAAAAAVHLTSGGTSCVAIAVPAHSFSESKPAATAATGAAKSAAIVAGPFETSASTTSASSPDRQHNNGTTKPALTKSAACKATFSVHWKASRQTQQTNGSTCTKNRHEVRNRPQRQSSKPSGGIGEAKSAHSCCQGPHQELQRGNWQTCARGGQLQGRGRGADRVLPHTRRSATLARAATFPRVATLFAAHGARSQQVAVSTTASGLPGLFSVDEGHQIARRHPGMCSPGVHNLFRDLAVDVLLG
jgi:hypothetical protein